MGTETRRPPAEYIPPQDTPYEFILFRAQEVKDLNVDSQPLAVPATRNVRDDPAIIGVSPDTMSL
jgi:protein LSM14